MEKKQIKAMVDNVGEIKQTSFVSAVYRSKETGELARYVLNVGIAFHKVLERDLKTLRALWADSLFFLALVLKYGDEIVNKAFTELEKSLVSSLEGTNERAQAQIDAYVKINKGVKWGIATGKLYLYGFLVSKKVLEQGTYKQVKSKPLTLCKNEIKKHFKSGKFRTLTFDGTNVFTSNGERMEFSNE